MRQRAGRVTGSGAVAGLERGLDPGTALTYEEACRRAGCAAWSCRWVGRVAEIPVGLIAGAGVCAGRVAAGVCPVSGLTYEEGLPSW